MCGIEGSTDTKALRLAWWGAEGCTLRGQGPAGLLGRGGRGWVLIRALSPAFSIQGSLPQLPPVAVMAAPALSWCLCLLVLWPLAIPRASTSVNGEDPGIWTAVLSLREEAKALLELLPGPLLLGRSSIRWGRRRGGGGQWDQRPGVRLLPQPSTCPHRTHVPLQAAGRHRLLVPALPRPVWGSLQAMGLSFVLSQMDSRTPSLPTRIDYFLTW